MLARRISIRQFTDGINFRHSSQLQVMHTNSWPIPYYKRANYYPRTAYPESDYNVSLTGTEVYQPDEVNVFKAIRELKKTAAGMETLAALHNLPGKGAFPMKIASPSVVADVYTKDLLRHINYVRKQNKKILEKVKFSSVFDQLTGQQSY